MSCKSCDSVPPKPANCSTPELLICQPLPYPVTITVEAKECLAETCTKQPVTLQEFADTVADKLCKLHPDEIGACTLPVGNGAGDVTWKPVNEAIAGCIPGNPGDVLTTDGVGGSSFQPAISCTKLKQLQTTCYQTLSTPPTTVFGTGSGGLGYYQPAKLDCNDLLSKLASCPPQSSTPATSVLALQGGAAVYAPLPTLTCSEFLPLFSCIQSSTTPTNLAITLVGGVPKLAPIAKQSCIEFQSLLTSCPSVSQTAAQTVLSLQNGVAVYAPLPTAPVAPPQTPPTCADVQTALKDVCVSTAPACVNPLQLLGRASAGGSLQNYVRSPRYNFWVSHTGANQSLGSPAVLNDLSWQTIEQESGLCGSPSWFNPTTNRLTIGRDGVYHISGNRYVRVVANAPAANQPNARYQIYMALTVVRAVGVVEGNALPAKTYLVRSQEYDGRADGQVTNFSFSIGEVTLLPAGSQIWWRVVVINQPTGAVTFTSVDSIPSGSNFGADGFFRVVGLTDGWL